jgi:hypothetical protein
MSLAHSLIRFLRVLRYQVTSPPPPSPPPAAASAAAAALPHPAAGDMLEGDMLEGDASQAAATAPYHQCHAARPPHTPFLALASPPPSHLSFSSRPSFPRPPSLALPSLPLASLAPISLSPPLPALRPPTHLPSPPPAPSDTRWAAGPPQHPLCSRLQRWRKARGTTLSLLNKRNRHFTD